MMWKQVAISLALVLAAACSGGPHLTYEENGGGNGADGGDSGGGGSEPPVTGVVSVDYLKSLYGGAPKYVAEEVSIRGRVIENDFSGNFYKMLVVGDGTANIEIRADSRELFRSYPRGSVVTVHCNGLMLGADGGMVRLGAKPKEGSTLYDMDAIGAEELPWRIQKEDEPVQEVLPDDTLTISGLSSYWLGRLVGFEGVQFVDEEVGAFWTENGTDTDRHLVDRRGDTLAVRTGRYADFAGSKLPEGSGYIEGILEYFNGKYQLRMGNDAYAVLYSPRFEVAVR